MNFDSLNIILTIAAFIVGIMLLTGHGDIFLKGGNSDISKKLYDEEKMAKASGVALIFDWRCFRHRSFYYSTGL